MGIMLLDDESKFDEIFRTPRNPRINELRKKDSSPTATDAWQTHTKAWEESQSKD